MEKRLLLYFDLRKKRHNEFRTKILPWLQDARMQVRHLLKFVRKHLDAGNRDQVYFAIDDARVIRKAFPNMIY